MRELRGDVDAAVEARRHGPLPLQRLRSLLQDERPESAAHQTQTETGKSSLTHSQSSHQCHRPTD